MNDAIYYWGLIGDLKIFQEKGYVLQENNSSLIKDVDFKKECLFLTYVSKNNVSVLTKHDASILFNKMFEDDWDPLAHREELKNISELKAYDNGE